MILSASNYLLETLEPVEGTLQKRQMRMVALAAAAATGLAVLAGYYVISRSSSSQSSNSSQRSSSHSGSIGNEPGGLRFLKSVQSAPSAR
jgi:hypothetical protein